MEPDQYVKSIIGKYAITEGRAPAVSAAAEEVYKVIQQWVGMDIQAYWSALKR